MSWQQVRGHDALVDGFDRAVQRGRLAHAYLFIGPPGIGKRLFALELAKALLCEQPAGPRLEACDHCPSCLLFDAGTHPDFFAAGRPEENLTIPRDVIVELCRNLSLKPARGRRKIAVLDDADDLNTPGSQLEAANAFLKTLEEPPEGSVLILIGTSVEQQLATIVSRCQIVYFTPLPAELVADLLRAQGIDDATLVERLVQLSGGSPGKARELADPELWEFRRVLLQGLTRTPPDTVGLARQWVQFVEEAGKESAAQRRRAALVLQLLIDFLANALSLSVDGTPRLAEPDDLLILRALMNRTEPERLVELLNRCLEADMHIDRRVQLSLVLEALLDTLGRPSTSRTTGR